jgi:PleD family two-component response regulator
MNDKKSSENQPTGFPMIKKTDRLINVGKILVVDDEKFNCDIIEGFLMILGYEGG